MDKNYQQLINKLKQYRISIFKTQTDVSIECGLSLRTIINIEKGSNVSMDNFVKYLDSLGLVQSFVNFPPITQSRFEDIPKGKYERQRTYRKRK